MMTGDCMRTNISASVVGMKYYGFTPTDAMRQLRGQSSLIREPHNTHDTNAIAVTGSGKTIGHIDKRTAAILAPLLDSGATYELEIKAVVGQSISAKVCIVQNVQSVSVPRVCGAGTVGIYAIWADDVPYVGQSKDIQNRISQHWSELQRGTHLNPQLRRLWSELGPSRFSAKVLELAPPIPQSLELARWLHNRECDWIETFGGLREVINADSPRPVLDDHANQELQAERDAAGPTLLALDDKYRELAQLHEMLCSSIDELRSVVSKAERFWGVFNSGKTESEAESARRKIPALESEARKAIDERIALQSKIADLKRHLFIRN